MEGGKLITIPTSGDPIDGSKISAGNAGYFASSPTRGWFLGEFVKPEFGLRHSTDLEVKWGIHKAGEQRVDASSQDGVMSLAILISGSFVLDFPNGEASQHVHLATQGDYVLYSDATAHSWRALEDSVVLTIRWPSVSKGHRNS